MDIKKVLRGSAEGLGFRYNEENTLAVGEKTDFSLLYLMYMQADMSVILRYTPRYAEEGAFPKRKK